jgi:hypothetical protein
MVKADEDRLDNLKVKNPVDLSLETPTEPNYCDVPKTPRPPDPRSRVTLGGHLVH